MSKVQKVQAVQSEEKAEVKTDLRELSITVEDMLEAGCHFGHQARRWSPKIEPYLYGAKDGIHIFDLFQTYTCLQKAAQRAYELGAAGKSLVFLGTKRQAQAVVQEEALQAGAPFVTTRWLGGTITNWDQIKKSIHRMNTIASDLDSGTLDRYTKRERILLEKEKNRFSRFLGGISHLKSAPDALFVIDIQHEKGAIKEARTKDVEVIGIVDTNADPNLVQYPIPANDDAIRSIKLIVHEVGQAYKQGVEAWQKNQSSQ